MKKGTASHHLKRRRLRLLDGDDFTCTLLGSLGFSTKLIMARTGLSPSQIGYRLRVGGIKRSDYRDGESPLADSMLERGQSIAISTVEDHLLKFVEESRL